MLPSSITKHPQADRLRRLLRSRAVKRLQLLAALCIGLAVLDLLVYAFAVTPAAAYLEGQRQRYGEIKKQYADAVLFRKQKAELSGLQAGIPLQKDVPLLIKEIVQTARKQNLSVGPINSDIPTPGNDGLAMLTFSVPLSGGYANIKRFIFEMETTDRLLGIQDVKLDGEKGTVKLQAKLVTYVRGE